jgi:hypothetical protein
MSFEELEKNKLTAKDYLWKYLDFHKFLYLILEKKLFFTRLDLLDDPFEGITTKSIKDKFLADSIPNEKLLNPLIPEEERKNMLKQKESLDNQYNEDSIKSQKTQFVNCWLYENRESMAMWNTYSNRDSVAITINGRDFVDYLKRILELQPLLYKNNKFICGHVDYFALNPIDISQTISGVKYSSFKKDLCFRSESEYRLLIVEPNIDIESIPYSYTIDLTKNFFDSIRVVCHPQMEEWKINSVKKLCENYGINNITKSSIIMK